MRRRHSQTKKRCRLRGGDGGAAGHALKVFGTNHQAVSSDNNFIRMNAFKGGSLRGYPIPFSLSISRNKTKRRRSSKRRSRSRSRSR